MWVRFKIWWQDGLYVYNPGKVVLLPPDLGRRYCESGKAEECNPPKWAAVDPGTKKKRKVPSGRTPVRRITTATSRLKTSFDDMASEVMGDDE